MITLQRDTLTFTFPKTARDVQSLVEQKIQRIAAELPPTSDRAELISQIESYRDFPRLTSEQQERARERLRTWTPANVEALLREFAFDRSGLGPDSFASLGIKFQRTMRLPENDYAYELPTGLGQFPLRSVDDFQESAPMSWIKRGGVVMPVHRSEALSIWFSSRYRFAVKLRIGDRDALSNTPWSPGLQRRPQNYLVAPNPPWEEGDEVVRRMVAMPLRSSEAPTTSAESAENQNAIQFEITPIRAESVYRDEHAFLLPPTIHEFFMKLIFAPMISKQLEEIKRRYERRDIQEEFEKSTEPVLATAQQKIIEDRYQLDEWNQAETVRCFVHVCDRLAWRRMTGTNPTYSPLTETEYVNARIPWSDEYASKFQVISTSPRKTIEGNDDPSKVHRRSDIRPFVA